MTYEEELKVIERDHELVRKACGVPKRVPGLKRNHTHSWTRAEVVSV